MIRRVFSYISDLHLEIPQSTRPFLFRGTNLILAGDIGSPKSKEYQTFLKQCSDVYQNTFLVMGNHEYYGKSIEETNNVMRDICLKLENVYFLNNNYVDLNGVILYGGTMWSLVPFFYNPVSGDNFRIKNFNFGTRNNLFREFSDGLQTVLTDHPNKKIIVVSHHLPRFDLIHPKFKNLPVEKHCLYASDLLLADHSNIVKWVHGHTHHPVTNFRNKFLCNPGGYPLENKVRNIKTFCV